MTMQHDPARVPQGSQVRRLTASIENARQGHGFGAVVQEVWYVVITVALCVVLVVGVAGGIKESAPVEAGAVTLVGELPGALALLAAAGGLLSLAGRLGPVGLGGGGASWWLPMPVDRRGLLRPTVLRWPLVSAAVGGVLAPLAIVLFGTDVTPGLVLRWAALGAAGFSALAAVASLLQPIAHASRIVAVTGEILMLLAAGAIAAVALTGRDTSAWTLAGGWLLAVPLAVVAVVATVLAERHSTRLSGAGLRERGSVGDRAQVAVLSLDLRELSGALAAPLDSARRKGSLRLAARGPRRAIALADAVLLSRAPRQLAQVAVSALFVVTAGQISLTQAGLPLYGVWLITGFWATNAAAAGARHADLAPVLDRLFPLSARDVRVARGSVPLVAATVWAVAAFVGHAFTTGQTAWLALAPAWVAVLGAAAVRSAYRPAPRWTATVVSPMGGVPPTGGLFKGLDVALIGTLPTAVALYTGTLSPMVIGVQAVWAAASVAVLVALSGRRKST